MQRADFGLADTRETFFDKWVAAVLYLFCFVYLYLSRKKIKLQYSLLLCHTLSLCLFRKTNIFGDACMHGGLCIMYDMGVSNCGHVCFVLCETVVGMYGRREDGDNGPHLGKSKKFFKRK